MINVRPPPPALWVTKSGTQTVGRRSWIQLTGFDTEAFDTASAFSSNTFTPPAGKYVLGAWYLLPTGLTANNPAHIAIYKNGALYSQASVGEVSGLGAHSRILMHDVANGTDYYNVYCWIEAGTGTVVVQGGGMFGYRFEE